MRSNYQIESAQIARHTADFEVWGKGARDTVTPKVLKKTFKGVKYGWMQSTGLTKGPAGEVSIFQGGYRSIEDNSMIVMRWFKNLFDAVMSKDFVIFQHGSQRFSITKAIDVNGEQTYLALECEFLNEFNFRSFNFYANSSFS